MNTWNGITVVGNRVWNIYLGMNNLSGTIPASIGDLDSLKEISLTTNHLRGNIPATIGNFSALISLDWSGNRLTGNLPFSIMKLRKIQRFDVSYNLLTAKNNDSFYISAARPFVLDIVVNRFTFNEIESVARSFPNAYYAPQQRISIHQHDNALSVSAGGTLSNNTYKWLKVGVAGSTTISGDSVFIPSSGGTYYVRVTNSIATKLTLSSDTFFYAMPEAKNISSQNNQVHIYPNPVKDILNICGLNVNATSKISVADVAGAVWMKTTAKSQSAFNLDVSKLHAGNYVLIITDNSATRKISFIKE